MATSRPRRGKATKPSCGKRSPRAELGRNFCTFVGVERYSKMCRLIDAVRGQGCSCFR
jgi:hypothetical protein